MPAKRGMRISGPIGIIGDGCDWKSNLGFAGRLDWSQGVNVHVHEHDVRMYVYMIPFPLPCLRTCTASVNHQKAIKTYLA